MLIIYVVSTARSRTCEMYNSKQSGVIYDTVSSVNTLLRVIQFQRVNVKNIVFQPAAVLSASDIKID